MTYSPRELRQVDVFAEASDSDLEEIARNSIERSVEEGGYLFFQGDAAEYLYVLTKGLVKLVQSNPNGRQVNIRTIQPWDMFAALGAVRTDAAYPASAQALQDSSVLAIRSDFMNGMMQRHPFLAVALTRLMTSNIQEMQSRYRELATERVEQRIAHTLLRLVSQTVRGVKPDASGIKLEFSRQDLAEMAGTTLFTVSRVLSEWEKLGIIEAGRENIRVMNQPELRKIAESQEG